MSFPPAPRKDQRFVLLFFIGHGKGGKKKTGKGDLKEYFSRSVVIILELEAIEFSCHQTQWSLDFYISAKSQLLQHVANHGVESSCVCLCPGSTEGNCTHPMLELLPGLNPRCSSLWLWGLTGGQSPKTDGKWGRAYRGKGSSSSFCTALL